MPTIEPQTSPYLYYPLTLTTSMLKNHFLNFRNRGLFVLHIEVFHTENVQLGCRMLTYRHSTLFWTYITTVSEYKNFFFCCGCYMDVVLGIWFWPNVIGMGEEVTKLHMPISVNGFPDDSIDKNCPCREEQHSTKSSRKFSYMSHKSSPTLWEQTHRLLLASLRAPTCALRATMKGNNEGQPSLIL